MNWNWNQNRVDEFMQHISTGFVPPSPLELALQLTALFVVVFAYSLIYRRMTAGRRLARETHSASRFIEVCHDLRLPPGDRELLRQLAEYLPHPREELHILLREREVFQRALDALLHSEYQDQERPGAARPFTALAVRLGFKAQSSGRIVRSTGDLPPDTILFNADDTPLFRVLEVHPAHLDVVLLKDLPADWKNNRDLELNFRRREGYYMIEASIIATETGTGVAETRAVLSHNQGRITRRQNRKHFRRDIRLPVRFGKTAAHTVNLSGGGALIELDTTASYAKKQEPVEIPRPGDTLELVLEINPRTIVRCTARAILVQDEGRSLQLEFATIQAADRDRIIKLLFGEEGRSAHAEQNHPPPASIFVMTGLVYLLTGWMSVASFAGDLAAEPAPQSQSDPAIEHSSRNILTGGDLGDYYYSRGKYDLARIEYDRRLRQLPDSQIQNPTNKAPESGKQPTNSERQALAVRAKLGLSLMRTNQYRESLVYLNNRRDFSHLYLGMFAAFRSGWTFQGLTAQSRILDRDDFSPAQRDQARLLGGAVYLESGEYNRVRTYYANLQKVATDESVRLMSGRLLTSLDGYESLDRKNAWLAAGFSTVLPGAGQIYAGHTVDGITALFFNGMFLGSALVMYDLENRSDSAHIGSGVFGVLGLVFYLANISGAYQTAHRYNAYQERRFQQDVREAFFHLDYIEKNSGVVFETDF